VVQVDRRTKSVDSFVEKISRKNEKYVNPLDDMTDLAGLRIIAYYTEDVETIGRLIKQEFAVDAEKSVDKVTELDPSQFGYTSVHYVVSLGPTRRDLPEWSRYADRFVEIQVRTALQHAWAAVDHKLRYKTTQEVPSGLRRRLFRLSALFELADDQFSELRRASQAVLDSYSRDVRRGNLELELDASSLNTYLSLTPWLDRLTNIANEVGWEVDPLQGVEKTVVERDKRDLLSVAQRAGITDIAGLDRILTLDEGYLRDQAEVLVNALKESDPEHDAPRGTPYDALTLFIAHELKVNQDVVRPPYLEHIWKGLEMARKPDQGDGNTESQGG
jgi:ppGpp synthetase/RelA/SpoT-type nucleotidyltranferase